MKFMIKEFIVCALSITTMTLWAAGGQDANAEKGDAQPAAATKKASEPPNPFMSDFKTIERLQKQIDVENNKKPSFGGPEGDKVKKDKIDKISKQIATVQEKVSRRIEAEIKKLEDEQTKLQNVIDKLSEKEGSEAEVKKIEVKVDALAKQVDQWNAWGSPSGPPPPAPAKDEAVNKGKDALKKGAVK